MALCHDERDFAMGFSRRDPHAHRKSPSQVREGEQLHARLGKYYRSLSPSRKRAHKRVEFCVAAIGSFCSDNGMTDHLPIQDLHKHFPAFAKEMGWTGLLYGARRGKCPAVGIAYPQNMGAFWIISPLVTLSNLGGYNVDQLHTKQVRQASLNFCKAWHPEWPWREPATTT